MEALRAVEVVINLLVAAGQLPVGYGKDARNQLPRPPPLFGRDAALAGAREVLQRERQLVIVGGPGEGKSAVAAETAHRMADDNLLPGGVVTGDLAAVPRSGELRRMLCACLHVAPVWAHTCPQSLC